MEAKLHEYLYMVENVLDEIVIAMLSLGTIFVSIYVLFWVPQDVGLISFGNLIEPWITMLALMLIARELWLMNRHRRMEAADEGE